MRRRIPILALAAVLVSGCGYNSMGGENRPDPDYITRDEIMSVDARDLYDVVRRLRPRWINVAQRSAERSFRLQTTVVVYQGQMYLGEIETLGNWSPSAAYGLEWLDGSTASATLPGLGSRHVAGAIVIHTSPQPEK